MLAILALVLAPSPVLGFGAAEAPCISLQQKMNLIFHDFPLRINKVNLNVTVMGAGGGARAAAALLLVAFRYGLGYSTRLDINTPNLCDLANKKVDWRNVVNVVAPVAIKPGGHCDIDVVGFDFITTHDSAVVDASLHLMAYIPHSECKKYITNAILNINISVLESCGFTTTEPVMSRDSSVKYYGVLARKENSFDDYYLDRLQKEIELSRLPLKLVYFANDTHFRTEIYELKTQNKTFLLLDEYIWIHISNNFQVQLSPGLSKFSHSMSVTYASSTFRVGDGFSTRDPAPNIYKIIRNFKPSATDLLQILENEIIATDKNIEEAACLWALQHDEQFKKMIPFNFNDMLHRSPFIISVYVCDQDTVMDKNDTCFEKIKQLYLHSIKYISLDIQCSFINCLDDERVGEGFFSLANSRNIVGLVTWNTLLAERWTQRIERFAINVRLPLLLAGPVLPNKAAHAATGTLVELVRAYLHLLQICKWSRVGILSDYSIYSEKFMALFRKMSGNKIFYRSVNVETSNVDSAVEKLHLDDARIFLVNANLNITNLILCTALKRGITGDRYIWITRDWQMLQCDEDTKTPLHHYTLELTSRRGPAFVNLTSNSNSSTVSETIEGLLVATTEGTDLVSETIRSSSMTDALLQFGFGFAEFIREHPFLVYSLREPSDISNVSHILETRTQSDARSFAHPIVIIAKWVGSKGKIAAAWHMTTHEIVDINWDGSGLRSCEDIIRRKPPEDRATCLVQTGDQFAPRCHSTVTFISVPLLVILLSILFILYRKRRASIQLHRKQYEEYLISSRQRTTSVLENYLVKRQSVQLLHIIGLGSFGLVRFAKLHKTESETVVVAAKEPRDCFAVEDENSFLHEACVLAPLRHENVIRLVGVCLENGPPMVLMEHAFYNDLQQYLTLRRQYAEGARCGTVTAEQAMEVSDEELTRFGREAAGALEYLATCRLVHRDVRAGNCLVDKNRSLKLADFGMARELDSEEPRYVTQRRALFPVIWMAPESINSGVFSPASDVWSLGVLLLEVATFGARPFGDWSVEMVARYVKAGGHPPLPPDTSTYTSRLVLDCWQFDPQSRPTAAAVRRYLSCNPHAICPALLTPHPPESPVKFTQQN